MIQYHEIASSECRHVINNNPRRDCHCGCHKRSPGKGRPEPAIVTKDGSHHLLKIAVSGEAPGYAEGI